MISKKNVFPKQPPCKYFGTYLRQEKAMNYIVVENTRF